MHPTEATTALDATSAIRGAKRIATHTDHELGTEIRTLERTLGMWFLNGSTQLGLDTIHAAVQGHNPTLASAALYAIATRHTLKQLQQRALILIADSLHPNTHWLWRTGIHHITEHLDTQTRPVATARIASAVDNTIRLSTVGGPNKPFGIVAEYEHTLVDILHRIDHSDLDTTELHLAINLANPSYETIDNLFDTIRALRQQPSNTTNQHHPKI